MKNPLQRDFNKGKKLDQTIKPTKQLQKDSTAGGKTGQAAQRELDKRKVK